MDKYLVYIVSGGRTGTAFLGNFLKDMVTDSYSVHEPDIFFGLDVRTWEAIKRFGLYHVVFGRMLGLTGIRNLSQRYQNGRLSLESLSDAIRRQRYKYYKSIDQSLIIESYYQWYGILSVVPYLFEHYKVLGVIRDPRTWVVSYMNFETHFGKRDWVSRFGLRRLDPFMVGDNYYAKKWPAMTPFQKLCWTWSRVYGLIFDFEKKNTCTLLLRYEDLFLSVSREKHFREMLEFITDFGEYKFTYDFCPQFLDEKVNVSKPGIWNDWRQWDSEHAKQLQEICGSMMTQFGYGCEPEWLEMVE